MSVDRISTIFLVLFLQVAAVVSPFGFVYCVHDDGRRMIEPVWATCCRTLEPEDPCCSDVSTGKKDESDNQTQEDSCKDYPLATMDVQFPNEANQYEAKVKGSSTVIADGLFNPIAVKPKQEFSGYIGYYDPLTTSIQLHHIRTVVLHC